ncbi:TonB-dependent receptor plug domain-containing protein [Dyadobacter sp. NIV53]|uniref:TonB-dependent receptor plug domain-containing protein n=1 Tax=Dyadobacter sp. NIV53 TaxID=2861765 RepID=UPI001C86937D|nr:TonB-dependent receptor plug domain-containing protein [Dyadobacter sp. NIV53]
MPCTKTLLKLSFLLFSILLLAGFQAVDEDFAQKVAGQLLKYRGVFPQEKAYLHLDKPYYTVGDTLWYKGYLVEGSLHQADSASQVLYVDLIEQSTGKNIALRRTRLEGGVGHGDIVLPDSIPNGAYTIRAYTNWMRNFSEDFFFQKSIYLFGQEQNTVPATSELLDIQFFPEGGQLLTGISTRVAFKAVNGNGLGQDIDGFVLNQKKDTITSFKSEHLGLGRFQFQPEKDQKYQAYVRKKDGTFQSVSFPLSVENGFSLIVDNLSSPSKMRILVYHNFSQSAEKQVHVVGHSRGIIAFAAKGKVSAKGLMINLPKTELPDGITHLTLFDDQNKPVCERLVFIDHGNTLKVKINPSKPIYKPREKAELEIMVTDTAGNPVETNLSVAVTDEGQIAPQPYDMNLVSNLLLTSDLKGFVEQPAYYFNRDKSERKIHLDYLMMTQGWSRFKWEDVLKDSLSAPQRFVEQGITLAGQVKRNNKQISEKVMLSVFLENDSISTILTPETDATGLFAIHNLVFSDTLNFRLQGANKKGNQNLSFLMNLFEPPKAFLVKIPYYPITVDAVQLNDYLKRAEEYQEIVRKIRESRERLLKEVTIKAKKVVERDSRKLYTNADATIKVTSQMAAGAFSILDIIAARVAGVQVVGSGMNASVFIRGNRGEPLFVLDGMTGDKNMITSVNVNDVESIDVLKGASAAIYGSRGGNGVIAVYTKRGNTNYDYSQDIVPGVLSSKIAGFNIPREFYNPKYEVTRQEDARPDYRSTVFWAPMLKTGKDGKARFQYYNTDAVTKIAVQAEVLSAGGLPGSAKTVYSVQ